MKYKKYVSISLVEHTRTPRKLPKIGWGGSKYIKLENLTLLIKRIEFLRKTI
jgi:hypothetical protein